MQCCAFDPDVLWWLFLCHDAHSGYEYDLLLDTASTSVTMMRETLKIYPDLAQTIQMSCSFPSARPALREVLKERRISGRWCLYTNDGKHIARILGHSLVVYNEDE